MQISKRIHFGESLALSVMATLLLAGCGGDTGLKDALPTFRAKGTLSLDGKPFGPAQIRLQPDDNAKPVPGGFADASGNFVLKTYNEGDGAPAGAYKVYILRDPVTKAPSHPQVYDSAETTLLSATIRDGSNELTLDMKSDAGPPAPSAGTATPGTDGYDPFAAYQTVRGPGAK